MADSATEPDELTCFLASGSDRAGALDVQTLATTYTPRLAEGGTLDHALAVADLVDRGTPLPADLDLALRHGTLPDGARPKAFLDDDSRKRIAKFSSSTLPRSCVRHREPERPAMDAGSSP